MAIAKQIVELHEAEIMVHSEIAFSQKIEKIKLKVNVR